MNPVASRLAALSRGVDRARPRPKVDVRRAMLFVGALGMGLGFVAIVFGWYGASHSAYLFQEIPYLISGGLLGVALVAGGGFLFLSAWFVRMIEENRRQAARLERALTQLDRAPMANGNANGNTNANGNGIPEAVAAAHNGHHERQDP